MKVQAQLCPFQDDGSVVVDSFLMFLSFDCGGSVFGPCLIMHYLVFFLVLQSSWRERESMMSYFNCLPSS